MNMQRSLSLELEEHRCCYLTTTGRSSGKPHRIEIWFVILDETLYVISGGQRRSDWVKNLMADPHLTYEVGAERGRGAACFLDNSPDHPARERLAERYQGWKPGEPLTRWAAEGLLVEITPVARSGEGDRAVRSSP